MDWLKDLQMPVCKSRCFYLNARKILLSRQTAFFHSSQVCVWQQWQIAGLQPELPCSLPPVSDKDILPCLTEITERAAGAQPEAQLLKHWDLVLGHNTSPWNKLCTFLNKHSPCIQLEQDVSTRKRCCKSPMVQRFLVKTKDKDRCMPDKNTNVHQ